MLRSLMLGMLVLAASPVAAQSGSPGATSAAVQPIERPTPAAASTLAELMSPRDLMIANEQRLFREQFPAELRKQDGFAELEAEYPTLIPEILREMEQPFRGLIERKFDTFIPQVAKLIEDNLTAAEVTELTTFYRSPAGQRTVQAMATNSDTREISDAASSGGKADEAMLRRQLQGAASKTAESLSEEDRTAFAELMMTSGFWSLAKIQKQLLELKARALNADDPQYERETEEAFEKVMARIMSQGASSQ